MRGARELPFRVPESAILSQIMQYLYYINGGYFWRQNTGAMPIDREGQPRRYFRAGTPGCSDIVGVYKGRFIACEVKASDGRLSELQERFMDRVREAGGIAFVARDVQDVIDELAKV